MRIPWLLGLVATRSLDKEVPGVYELVEHARQRIASGVKAHQALQGCEPIAMTRELERCSKPTRRTLVTDCCRCGSLENPSLATPADIERAAWMTVPDVPVLFWCFRVMVGLGIAL